MLSQDPGELKPDLTKTRSNDGKDKNTSNRRKGRTRGQRNRFVQPAKFKGKTEALHSYIYDVGTSNQADLFTKTTKKIASYAGRTCKEPQDIRRSIEDIDDVDIPMPTKRTSIINNRLREKLFDKGIESWAKRKSIYR